MELEKFLNKYSDWEERLAAAPYWLEIKHDGDFVLFKYNQYKSDMRLYICQEARGSIFVEEKGTWRCVCYPFRKFFNWQEENADELGSWDKVKVLEKVDGSLMKMWNYRGLWFISTNNTINAFSAPINENISFGKLFTDIVYDHMTLKDFGSVLNPRFCYMFELVSPLNRLVVEYKKSAIYFLGARNMETYEEMLPNDIPMPDWVRKPREYLCSSFVEALWECENMGADEEGYVCRGRMMENGSFARIKVKGAEYLRLAKLSGKGPLTTSKIISMWQEESLDDYLAIWPENRPRIEQVVGKIEQWIQVANIAYSAIKGFKDRKDLAMMVNSYVVPLRGYLFARVDGKNANAREWFKQLDKRKIEKLMEE